LKEKGMVNRPAPRVFWAMVKIVAFNEAVPRKAGCEFGSQKQMGACTRKNLTL
jgi:hypothetical protein